MRDRYWWSFLALSGATTVGAGAFAAHALQGQLSAPLAAAFDTAVRYQAWHTLALLGVLAWRAARPLAGQRLVLGCWSLGLVLFSGSLYALALAGPLGRLGLVTPLGGLLLIAGWLALLGCVWRHRPAHSASGSA